MNNEPEFDFPRLVRTPSSVVVAAMKTLKGDGYWCIYGNSMAESHWNYSCVFVAMNGDVLSTFGSNKYMWALQRCVNMAVQP